MATLAFIPWTTALLYLAVLTLLYQAWRAFYNLFLSPLSKFPGPILWRVSRIPNSLSKVRGRLTTDILSLHEKYGHVVRITPDELSYADVGAWKDIMGSLNAGGNDLDKWDNIFIFPGEDLSHPSISHVKREQHTRMRKAMAPGFGDRAVRSYEPTIRSYADLLVTRLRERADGETPIDIRSWYNFATFDIIGQLGFGEDFGCLEKSRYHPWVSAAFENIVAGCRLQALSAWPRLTRLILFLAAKRVTAVRRSYDATVEDKVRKRMEIGKGSHEARVDMMHGLIDGMEKGEWSYTSFLRSSAAVLIAGSETSATMLSGMTYLLLANPGALARLTAEVRGAFSSEDEMTPSALAALPFLGAVIQETFRCYPAVPVALQRVTPKEGAVICGEVVPGNTIIGIQHWATYHNSKFFADPFNFHPGRWMGPEEDPQGLFAADQREVLQPFHLGPRSCLGKQTAYLEIRLILARILWAFDLELAPGSEGWVENQLAYGLWEKGPLEVYMKPVAA